MLWMGHRDGELTPYTPLALDTEVPLHVRMRHLGEEPACEGSACE